jgi:hypothetical protein
MGVDMLVSEKPLYDHVARARNKQWKVCGEKYNQLHYPLACMMDIKTLNNGLRYLNNIQTLFFGLA